MRRRSGVLVMTLALHAGAAPAQEPDPQDASVDSVVITPPTPLVRAPVLPDTVRPMSPRGAFIRSMILPGWGQSAFDANVRGGIFFAGWAGNWFMLFKTGTKLEEARFMYGLRERQLRDALIAGATDPDSMRLVLDTTNVLETTVRDDSLGNDLRLLVGAREQQREDWIALTIFWILASGIDGYVTAHLWDFPTGIDVQRGREGGVTLRLEVPLGRRRP